MSTEIQTLMGNKAASVNADLDPIESEIRSTISNFNRIIEADGFAFTRRPAPGYYDILVSGVQEHDRGHHVAEEALDFWPTRTSNIARR